MQNSFWKLSAALNVIMFFAMGTVIYLVNRPTKSTSLYLRRDQVIIELSKYFNMLELLSIMNMWGMIVSVAMWIRVDGDLSSPYWFQLIFAILSTFLHCVIFHYDIDSIFMMLLLSVLLVVMSYYHRRDDTWWLSLYMLQYTFTLPTFILLYCAATHKRDYVYVVSNFMLAVAYGLTLLGQSLSKVEHTPTRLACFALTMIFTMSAYDEAGHYDTRFSQITSHSHAYNVALLFYLAISFHDDVKAVCLLDWFIRGVVTMGMLAEL